MVVPYSPTNHLSHCLCEVQKVVSGSLSLLVLIYRRSVYLSPHSALFVLFLSLIAMASNRNEIFHFLLFCHFGFLTDQSVFLCQSPLAPGSLPYFHSMLSSPVVRDKLEPLFCVVYCVEFWKYFDLHLSILSLCVSSLARQFCFCFCLFSLWWILRRSGGNGGQFPFWRIATPYVVFSCFAVDRAYKALVSIRYIERIR